MCQKFDAYLTIPNIELSRDHKSIPDEILDHRYVHTVRLTIFLDKFAMFNPNDGETINLVPHWDAVLVHRFWRNSTVYTHTHIHAHIFSCVYLPDPSITDSI